MIALLSKELRSTLNSLSGIIFMVFFLVICGCLLWVIPGSYNILENGYSSLSAFFELAPVLLLLLIPALAMRTFAEEKRMQTLSLLLSRPVRRGMIITSKSLSVFLTVIIALIPTFIYVFCIYWLGSPVGNLDGGAIAGSYAGLLLLVLAFVSLSVFASATTSNQVVALILGLVLCGLFYWGFDLIAGLFSSGKAQMLVRELGLLSHYQSIQRGLIDSQDWFYLLAVIGLFYVFTLWVLGESLASRSSLLGISLTVLLALLSYTVQFRMDWTQDKRFSISQSSRDLLKQIDSPMEVDLYLDGQLNPGFIRLQQAALDLLSDFNRLSSGQIQYQTINPYQVQEKDFVKKLNDQGIRGVAVNEKNVEGKVSQQVIFPWVKIKYKNAEYPIPLLVNQPGRSGEENLNTSVEMLEYQLAHGLQLLMQKKTKKIVFLDGHGELPEASLNDVSDLLSQTYQIDRGILSGRPGELNDYALVVVAGPQQAFSERDKYALDQYVMQGGRVLWLVNGVRLQSLEALAQNGETTSMVNDVNLGDLLFTYGVRIDPVLLEDVQCLSIPVNTAPESATATYAPKPWYYAPLLLPNQDNPVTKGLIPLKTEFSSVLSFTGKGDSKIKKQVLLSSSQYAHLVLVPEIVTLKEVDRQPDKTYFNQSYLPVGVLLEGTFPSVFKNRVLPEEYQVNGHPFLPESHQTRMIVIASDEIIRNEIVQSEGGIQVIPIGLDRYSQTQYGNREFILNAVNYLTDDSGLASLRNKFLQLRLLDSTKIQQYRTSILLINVILPPSALVLFFLILSEFRKRKYKGKSWC